MIVEDIQAVLVTIRAFAAAGDYEAAHATEDKLLAATLRAIAKGKGDPQALAHEALQSLQIDSRCRVGVFNRGTAPKPPYETLLERRTPMRTARQGPFQLYVATLSNSFVRVGIRRLDKEGHEISLVLGPKTWQRIKAP